MYYITPKMYDLFIQEESATYGIVMPHDRLFKDILNEKEEFCHFINMFVNKDSNKKITPQEIEKVTTSFITPAFKNKETDILYKRVDEEKYYLVEHQSTVDDSMVYRMLHYCLNIMDYVIEKHLLKNKSYKIPKIIPIVLYTGEEKWNSCIRLTDKQENVDNDGTLIELKYKLVDINKINNEELYNANTAFAYGALIEKNKGKDKLLKILNIIAQNCNTETKEIKMKRIIKYILQPIIGDEETNAMMKKFNKMGGEEVMTAIECLLDDIRKEKEEARYEGLSEGREEGIEKGREEGIKEGRKEGKKEGLIIGRKEAAIIIAKELLNIGMDIKTICKITKLSENEIKNN